MLALVSNRAALGAVLCALLVGLLTSLAVRPATRTIDARDAGAPSTRAEARVRWRVPTAFSTTLPALGDNALWVSERIEAASRGRLRLQIFEPGKLVPVFDIVDAVRHAKVQAGYTWLGYDQGKLPASVLFGSVPFGMKPWEFSAWWYEGDGKKLALDFYEPLGVHPIFCGLIGPESAGWFRRPLRGPKDLIGLKIRFAGLGGQAMERLGASVTMLPGGEVFQALEKGAIDASEYSLPVVDERLGLDRVAHFDYFPGWHQPFTAFHLVVNDVLWRQLDDADRSLIDTACTAGATRNLARAEALQGDVLAGFEERGVHTLLLPDSILRALRTASQQLLDEQAQANPVFARVLHSQRDFSSSYERWRQFAYPEQDAAKGAP